MNTLAESLLSNQQRLQILLLVSHPDDDAIFAGQLQRQLPHHDWRIVCMTYSAATPRGREMISWQNAIGTAAQNLTFLSADDNPEDYRQKRCSINPHAIGSQLKSLDHTPDLVVTHNEIGEYEHPHHIMLHSVAREIFRQIPFLVFGYGLKQSHLSLAARNKWDLVCQTYPSQRKVIDTFRTRNETFAWLPH